MKQTKYRQLLPVYLVGLAGGKYTLKQASESTGYSVEWLCKLKQRYLKIGLKCLDQKSKGHTPKNKINEITVNKILELYKTPQYSGINLKYFRDCLECYENIKVSYSTILNIFKRHGLKSPYSRKVKKSQRIHRPRVRRDNLGDLLQLDATPFAWFSRFGNNKRYSLHGAIDDATSRVTGLYMTENECFYGYAEVMRSTIKNYGVPREAYSDRAAIFCVTPKKKKNLTVWEELAGVHDKRTQWQRALDELGVRQVLAWSPVARAE